MTEIDAQDFLEGGAVSTLLHTMMEKNPAHWIFVLATHSEDPKDSITDWRVLALHASATRETSPGIYVCDSAREVSPDGVSDGVQARCGEDGIWRILKDPQK